MSTTFPQINPDNLGFGINEMADHYSMKENKYNENNSDKTIIALAGMNTPIVLMNGSKFHQMSWFKTETGLTNITHEEGMKQMKITMNCINSQCDHVDGSVVSKLSTTELITLYERLNWFNPNHEVRMMQLLSIMKNIWVRHNSFIEEQVYGDNPQNYFVNKMAGGVRCQCEICQYMKESDILELSL